MIELEVIKSEDINRIGTFKFYTNSALLGSSAKNNIILDSRSSQLELILKIREDNIYLTIVNTSENILVNGKVVTRDKLLKRGDEITADGSIFKLQDFEFKKNESLKEYLNKTSESFQEKHTGLFKIIKEIQKENHKNE